MEDLNNNTANTKKDRRFKKRYVGWPLGMLIFLPIFIFILLNIPFVQNFIADKFAKNISKKINSEVSIDKIQFSVFRGLVANDFKIIESESQDTILNAGKFSVGLKQNIAFIFTNELRLNDIRLEDFNLKLITEKGDSVSNIGRMIKKLALGGDSTKTEGKPFALELDELDIRNFDISVINENDGSDKNFGFSHFLMNIDSIDLVDNYFVFSKIYLKNPSVLLNSNPQELKEIEITSTNIEVSSDDEKLLIEKGTIPFNFKIYDLEVENGLISSNTVTAEQLQTKNIFNSQSFTFDDIQFNASNIEFIDTVGLKLSINECSAHDAEGFSLKDFTTDFELTNRKLSLKKLNIQTDNSSINDEISLSFRKRSDFKNFANRVYILAKLNNSNIAFKELNYYFPGIRNVSFFSRNSNRELFLDGKLRGKLNNLSGRDISLSIDNQIVLNGRFDTRDITDPNYTLVNLEVESLKTNIQALKQIIPDFRPPENFDKLGNIDFSGRFDGFYYDFVAFGSLSSSVGRADLDMRLDVKEGRDNAKYSGVLNLSEFDLSVWSDNEDLGKVNLRSQVKDGKGLTRENAFADLNTEIISFKYKDYDYENIVFTGQIDESRINGDLDIKNDDIDFDFTGELFLTDSLYRTDFTAKINKLDLQALNLVDEAFNIEGNIVTNIEGSGMQDFIGEADLDNINIFYRDTTYKFDKLYVNSSPDGVDKRNANVISDYFSVSINGSFDLEKLPDYFKYQIKKSYPLYAKKLKINSSDILERPQEFDLKIKIDDSQNYFDLAGLNDFRLKDFTLTAQVNSDEEYIFIESDIDTVFNKSDRISNASLDFLNRHSTNKIKVSLDELFYSDRLFQPISVELDMNGDVAAFGINTKNIADSVEVLNLRGVIEPIADNFKIHFDDAQWVMFSSEWNFSKSNQIIVGDKYIDILNMSMTDGYRIIVLDDIDQNQGLSLSMRNFDFKLIDALIDYDKISFTGEGDLDLNAKQIFDKAIIDGNLLIPELMLNDISYGETVLDFHTSENTVVATASIVNDLHNIKVLGSYNTKEKYLDANLKGSGFQMKFFQDFIIGDGISKTQGYANVYADVRGPLDKIEVDGEARIYDGGVKINYLGNFIRFHDQKLIITEDFINFDDFEIIDVEGNVGVFQGGLHHDLLGDFEIEIDATGDRFVGLNTTKEDNALYHGYGVGDMDVKFRGPFHATDIKVNATTGRETVLNIPITYYQEGYENSFITFVDSTTHELTEDGFVAYIPEEFKIEGVDVEMNLQLTPEAEVNIIFNEQLNDIIKGRGEGNLRILLKRTGDFDVFGDYFVTEGEYLFTAWGVIAKPFIVRRGGTITWTGDPINAELDIDASYEGLRAPLNIFLSELLVSASPETQDISREKTEVDLNLHLGGSLFEPVVSFDLDFPNIVGELKSYATSKINTLRQNESEMNNQVVGLLIFNSFLPTASTINSDIYNANSVISTGYNTLSEMVSNQISFLLSGFLQEALEENGFISGIDFDIGFSKNSGLYGFQNENDNFAPDEIEVNLKNRFFDDRWELNLGGNFVRQSVIQTNINNNYIIGDFVLAYYLTEDKKLKLRVYGKYDLNEFLDEREQKYGFGISYRREFGSLFEVQKAIKEDTKNIFETGGSQ